MSSRGLYFNVQEPLQVGQALELLLDWPAKRANKERVRLVVLGRVVRIEKAGAAMTIQKYWYESGGKPKEALETAALRPD
jgi:hypothetical protein